MIGSLVLSAMLLAAAASPSEADEVAFAKCLWEKAPAEAKVIAWSADQIAFMQALIKGGSACGRSDGSVDIERFRKVVYDHRPKDSSDGRKK
jgi:hypothetical protein